MPNFPTEKKPERDVWSVWRGDTWLGLWRRKPHVGDKIKPSECLMAKKIVSIDEKAGRVYVK